MGHERKRGKLADLNRLLRGSGADRFSLVVGETAVLPGVRYVITLDTDTQLPRDAARQFVGAMAHPLNRPRFRRGLRSGGRRLRHTAAAGRREPHGASRSWYARMHGGDPGIDPYTRAVSDVYQDVFGEGSFIGKGIYDVDAFERALGGRFPEDRILSHDLLEGCYARSGLLSDVQLYEEYPSTYARGHEPPAPLDSRRLAARGMAAAVGARPRREAPRESAVGPVAVEDLRQPAPQPRAGRVDAAAPARVDRSRMPGSGCWWWSRSCCFRRRAPPGSTCCASPARYCCASTWRPRRARRELHAGAGRAHARVPAVRGDASTSTRSLRTSWRMLVSQAQAARMESLRPRAEPCAIDVDRTGDRGGRRAPRWRSRRRSRWRWPRRSCSPGSSRLRSPGGSAGRSSRREARLTPTAACLPAHAGAKDLGVLRDLRGRGGPLAAAGQLPGASGARVAHRTSPTNIGLALLANLAAYDFGYIPAGQLLERTREHAGAPWRRWSARGPLLQLVRHAVAGAAAAALRSTVDSGNLAGHLLTLRPGLLALADERIVDLRMVRGLGDTLRALGDATGAAVPVAGSSAWRAELETAYDSRPATVADSRRCLDRIAAPSRTKSPDGRSPRVSASDAAFWADALVRQCRSMQDELAFLDPPRRGCTDDPDACASSRSMEAGLPRRRPTRRATERIAHIGRAGDAHATSSRA